MSWTLTADVRGAPGHAHTHVVAGLRIGGHGCAETLTVAPRVTGARVAHAGLIVLGGLHLGEGRGFGSGGWGSWGSGPWCVPTWGGFPESSGTAADHGPV